jgi:hypothetical protein
MIVAKLISDEEKGHYHLFLKAGVGPILPLSTERGQNAE